jgi:hypothetical protein
VPRCNPWAQGPSIERLEDAIRHDAATRYGAECGSILIPSTAFFPVEMTGGGATEVAVSFARVRCGPILSRWTGTGGVVVQFWMDGLVGPRLLLEQQLHGFTPAGTRLITMQHGGFCPGGAGPDSCRVTYEWNERTQQLDVVDRQLASTPGAMESMQFDYETLSR